MSSWHACALLRTPSRARRGWASILSTFSYIDPGLGCMSFGLHHSVPCSWDWESQNGKPLTKPHIHSFIIAFYFSVREHWADAPEHSRVCHRGQGGGAELRLRPAGAGAVRGQVVQERTRILQISPFGQQGWNGNSMALQLLGHPWWFERLEVNFPDLFLERVDPQYNSSLTHFCLD